MSVRCEGPKVAGEGLQSQTEKVVKSAFGRTRHGEEGGPKCRGFGVVQKVFGLCTVSSVIELLNPCRP